METEPPSPLVTTEDRMARLFDEEVRRGNIDLTQQELVIRILGTSKDPDSKQERLWQAVWKLVGNYGDVQLGALPPYPTEEPGFPAQCRKRVPDTQAAICGISSVRTMAANATRLARGVQLARGLLSVWLANETLIQKCSVCSARFRDCAECDICDLIICSCCQSEADDASEDMTFSWTWTRGGTSIPRALRGARLRKVDAYNCCLHCYENEVLGKSSTKRTTTTIEE